jgi:hypothetical protein
VVTAILGALALLWYSAHSLESSIDVLTAQAGSGRLVLRKVSHEAGLFSSRGSLALELRPTCTQNPELPQASWRLDYTVNHLPSLTALSRFTWSAMPIGAPGAALAATGDGGWRLSGNGSVSYSGQIASTLDLPGVDQGNDGRSLRLPASKGTVSIGDNSFTGEWLLDQASLRNRDTALELKDIHLSLDLTDRVRGLELLAWTLVQLAPANWRSLACSFAWTAGKVATAGTPVLPSRRAMSLSPVWRSRICHFRQQFGAFTAKVSSLCCTPRWRAAAAST